MCSRSRADFCLDSSRPGKLMLNLRGRDDDISDERVRERVRFVDERLDMRERGRAKESRIAAVVLSMEIRAVRYWRRGEESDDEVEI